MSCTFGFNFVDALALCCLTSGLKMLQVASSNVPLETVSLNCSAAASKRMDKVSGDLRPESGAKTVGNPQTKFDMSQI